METVSLEMDDIFDERLQEEDTEQLPQMLPDLPEAEGVDNGQGTGNDDETENKKVLDKLKGMKGASKNTVKRPVPKLDSTRLTGERGIPILPRIFKDVKLKGKGHEVDDLRVVMRYLEHWGHRLFPKMPFDEVLERVERLGAKREVQTCIKKMRLDMPVLGSDTVQRGEDEEQDEAEGDQVQNQPSEQNPSAEELFDALIQEEQEMEAEMSGTSSAGSTSKKGQTAGDARQASDRTAQPPPSHADTVSSSTTLSSEVLERIERNRRLAMDKRAKKLGIPVANISQQGSSVAQSSTKEGAQEDVSHTTNQTELGNDTPVTLIDEHSQGSKETEEQSPDLMETLEEHTAPDSEETAEENTAPESTETPEEHTSDAKETSEEDTTPESNETSEKHIPDLMETSEEQATPELNETVEEHTPNSKETSEENTPNSKETSEEHAPDSQAISEEHATPDTMETLEKQTEETTQVE